MLCQKWIYVYTHGCMSTYVGSDYKFIYIHTCIHRHVAYNLNITENTVMHFWDFNRYNIQLNWKDSGHKKTCSG